MDTGTTPQADIYAVLTHPQENTVCLLQTAQGWSLPHISIDDSLWIRATSGMNNALQSRLGFPVIALNCLSYHYDDANREEVVHHIESLESAALLPEGGAWFGVEEVGAMHLAQPQHKRTIIRHLRQQQDGAVPPLRPPWSRPGWFGEASAWMDQALSSLDCKRLGPIEQTQSWCLSAILSAPTSRGRVFLKAGPDFPLFVNEPRLLAALSALFPDNIPAPLQIDPERRWMLLDDFGPALAGKSTTSLRSNMLRQFARLQQAAVNEIPRLLELGCIDRRLERLQQQLDQLPVDAEQSATLSAADLDRLHRAAPRLKALCERLAAIGIPETLDHGDLHLGNVAQQNGNLIFFDWTDACIAHPFLDMIAVFDEEDELLQARLRDDYLAQWQEYAAPHRLLEAWAIARPLFALHQAISYQSILMQLEDTPKQAFDDVVPHYVRRAIEGAEQIDL